MNKLTLGLLIGSVVLSAIIFGFMNNRLKSERKAHETELNEALKPIIVTDSTASNQILYSLEQLKNSQIENTLLLESTNRHIKTIEYDQTKLLGNYEGIKYLDDSELSAALRRILAEIKRRNGTK